MQPATQPVFVNDSWQTPRNARTLRAFMALRNQEIGARLRELRGEKPQTAVAEEIGVAERTYQNWEAGDAKPSYRNLQALADYYGVGENYILTGEGAAVAGGGDVDLSVTPSPFRDDVADRLGRIERSLEAARRERTELEARLDAAMKAHTDRIAEMVGRLEAAVARGETVTRDAESATRDLLVAVVGASRELRGETRSPAAEPETPAK